MLATAADSGTTDIVATPHFNSQYSYDLDIVERRIEEVIRNATSSLRIYRGCEFHLTPDTIGALCVAPSQYTINRTTYLLVDLDVNPIKIDEPFLCKAIDAGLIPIIAHPERNPRLQKAFDRLEWWIEIGCLLQVTASAITGEFGRAALSAAQELLQRGMVAVMASDSHDGVYRRPRLTEAYAAVAELLGEVSADLLLTRNPGAVLRGEPVETLPRPKEKVFR